MERADHLADQEPARDTQPDAAVPKMFVYLLFIINSPDDPLYQRSVVLSQQY